MTWTLSAFADEAGGTIEEQIAALSKAGYKHIDLRSVNGHNIAALPMDEAKSIKAKLDDAGIAVGMYGSPIGKIDVADDVQTDVDRLKHLGDLKQVFGATNVRLFSFYNKKENVSKEDWKAKSLENLSILKETALEAGLVLYHENESGIYGDKTDDVLDLAVLRDGKTFCFIYDFANYIRTGEDGWSSWQKMKETTDCFHFKDQKHNGQHVPMGQGDTDSTKILKDAADSGWAGPITLEPHMSFSDAVLVTGAHGSGDLSLKDMPKDEVFNIAAEAAKELITSVGAQWG